MTTTPNRFVLTHFCLTRWSLLIIAVSSSSCLMALKLPALAQIPPAFTSSNATLTRQGHLLEENEPPQWIADRRQENEPALREEADRLTQQGYIAYQSKLYLQAVAAYRQAAPLYHELRDGSKEARVLEELGLIYKILEHPEQAIESFQSASRLYKRGNYSIDSVRCLDESGTILLKTKRFTEASEILLEAIDSLESNRVSALNVSVGISRLGNWLPVSPAPTNNSGNTFVDLFFGLVSLVEEISASSRRISAEEADAIRTSLLDKHAKTYEKLQLALVAQNQIEKALEIAERGRSRASVELLASRSGSSFVSGGGMFHRSRQVRPLSVDQIKQIAATQKATLVEYSVIGNEVLYIWVVQPTGKVSFRPVALNPQAQNQITHAEAIASLIDRADPNEPPESVISILVKNIRREPDPAVALQQSHNLLIEPIADLLPTDPDQHVIFIPQSDIFQVPFAALLDSNGHYLIEKHTIRMIPSIQLLALTHKIRLDQEKRNPNIRTVNPDEVLIVGNPTMPRDIPAASGLQLVLTPLPAAEREAKTIAQMFQAEPLTGDRASESDVTKRMSHARIIHLATHGLFNNEARDQEALQQLLNGELKEQLLLREIIGAIVLTPSKKEDGLLTTREITKIDLANANLIVLSACDTGRGVIAADGVVGLSRALITAGAPSTIVSLWAVPDTPTANLMIEFYRQWQHYPDKAQALRQAMLKGMRSPNSAEQTSNPRDWAGFVLIGES